MGGDKITAGPISKIGESSPGRPIQCRRTQVLPHQPNPTDPTKLPIVQEETMMKKYNPTLVFVINR